MPEEQKANPRDTQFKGFAQLLAAEIANTDGWMLSEVEKLIARRAYDLVLHTVWRTIPASGSTIKEYQGLDIEEIAHLIPDMKEWTEIGE